MECDEENKYSGALDNPIDEELSRSAVNSLILDYYKKFGRKRDLEQYFSLSTAQSDIRDPSSLFWRRMKAQNDSSDSGERKSESSAELCRISIKCSLPEATSSQDENCKTNSDSESPPIITEDAYKEVDGASRNTDDESVKSDDNQSQKSLDAILDTSINKPLSPTSSITSQRKLEWDSLADVGYANESDRKTSASSLSTLERLALKQQFTNNDTKQDTDLGTPTAHSTLLDQNDSKSKGKKGLIKKTTKFYNKDVEFVEVNMPHTSDTTSQSINVNLTKHISFNVEKDGGVTIDNVKQDINVTPEKVSVETEVTPQLKIDKEIQTSLSKSELKSGDLFDPRKNDQLLPQRGPILITLNTLKTKNKRKKLRTTRRKLKQKKKSDNKENLPVQEKSVDQVSEAESFEYMPGHIYNQNCLKEELTLPINIAGNKSSLESSGALTTDSSKNSKHSFTKDLEKSLDLLKQTLKQRYDNSNVKKRLIEDIVQRLLKSKYRDDDSTTDFLSGLSFSSKKLGLGESNTTSTSNANSTDPKITIHKPKKSILRGEKFNPNAIASTSQSVPNLPVVSNWDKPVVSHLVNKSLLTSSNTESDGSSKGKSSSENAFAKTSSEELYQKYLEALKREQAYKKHLKDKEMFLKQKLVSSDVAIKIPSHIDTKSQSRLKDLMNDLTRNNYDDGSGDASKLEGGFNTSANVNRHNGLNGQRSHSVFTLSSGNSDNGHRCSKNKAKQDNNFLQPGTSKDTHYCCCPYHSPKTRFGVTDSSVQVNIKEPCHDTVFVTKPMESATGCSRSNRTSPRNVAVVSDNNMSGDIKYVCLCASKTPEQAPENILIYKCSRMTNEGIELDQVPPKTLNKTSMQCRNDCKAYCSNAKDYMSEPAKMEQANKDVNIKISSKSSQTHVDIASKMISMDNNDQVSQTNKSLSSKLSSKKNTLNNSFSNRNTKLQNDKENIYIHEATRSIQTEISIDPKISDPSLSDVNIIANNDCVKVINEQFKKVSKSRSDTALNTDDQYAAATCCDTKEKIERNEQKCEREVQQDIEQNIEPSDKIANEFVSNVRPEYKIPIKGTNMTLMVSLGSDMVKPQFKMSDKVSQGVGTESLNVDEKSTCLSEECSKGVQSQNTDIFSQIVYRNWNDDVNKNTTKSVKNDYERITNTKLDSGNVCCTGVDTRYNTYPKNVRINERKPLFRSNTDTDRIKKANTIQTNHVNKRDMETQESLDVQSHKSVGIATDQLITQNENLSMNSLFKCSTACGMEKDGLIPDQIYQCQNLNSNVEERNIFLCSNEVDIEHKHIRSAPVSARDPKVSQDDRQVVAKQRIIPSCSKSTDTDKSSKSVSIPKSQKPYLSQSEKSKSSTSEKSLKSSSIEKLCKCSTDEQSQKSSTDNTEIGATKDPILDIIQDITKRYSKKDLEKSKRKKCFKEIMTVLKYLLDTEESIESDEIKTKDSTEQSEFASCESKKSEEPCTPKKFVDKGVQLPKKLPKKSNTESSDFPLSTDIPSTSADSATCKVLNKIKKECEKYYQKRCRVHCSRKCEASSSTSINCEQCKHVHHCSCRGHKCKGYRPKNEKAKKCVAYNLIIQTSESMVSEEPIVKKNNRPLQNIIVRVPSKRKQVDKLPFKEVSSKIEKGMPCCSPRYDKKHRSRSLPSEISSADECRRPNVVTVRDYLEKNRPDFVDKCSQRQTCLKMINEKRAVERATQRELLSVQVGRQPTLSSLSVTELRHLAKELGVDHKKRKLAPKFISEREMKKHSGNIYKTLPEVLQKKEEVKKENNKKTNLLMANIFNKNLQKKTLRGAVNLSNYSTVIKI